MAITTELSPHCGRNTAHENYRLLKEAVKTETKALDQEGVIAQVKVRRACVF
jgi:hypothetical protein